MEFFFFSKKPKKLAKTSEPTTVITPKPVKITTVEAVSTIGDAKNWKIKTLEEIKVEKELKKKLKEEQEQVIKSPILTVVTEDEKFKISSKEEVKNVEDINELANAKQQTVSSSIESKLNKLIYLIVFFIIFCFFKKLEN
jgi:hypothetical protein